MSKTIENLKSGNYEVVDNQGVSVTRHFIECLEKEFADLEANLAEMTKKYELASCPTGGLVDRVRNLEQQLEEKDEEIEELKHFKVTIGTMENNQVDISSTTYADQDKISLALEQLEKVKDKALHFYVNDTPKLTGYYVDINEIDNQIKQLKEQK